MLERYLRIKNWFEGEEGQGLTEYALVLVLVIAIAVAVTAVLGPDLNGLYSDIAVWLGAVNPGQPIPQP